MLVRELADFIETLAPSGLQESYDNVGIQTGDPETEVTGVLVTLDITEGTIEESVKKGCNVVIAHHPLIFKGLKRLTGSTLVERAVIMAIRHHIAIIILHTNFDNAPRGLNYHLAGKLGIRKPSVLSPMDGSLHKVVTYCPESAADSVREAMFMAGGGRIGEYDRCSFNTEGTGTYRPLEGSDPYIGSPGEFHSGREVRVEMVVPSYLSGKVVNAMRKAHPYEEVAYEVFQMMNSDPYTGAGMWGELETPIPVIEFIEKVKQELGAEGIRYSRWEGEAIKRVGVCGGSGSFLIEKAIRLGMDALITSDLKYHAFTDYGKSLLLVDAGHFETELLMTGIITEAVQKKFTTFASHISAHLRNPIIYHK
ncbi:MAG TPA: Nif3-like dinuclear metal center hexameric protein [Bacteroidales bacterium]|nr:Nif3-like dinuclear metal center hexameric protein [Bacteroidales bacterium]HRZ49647.1 Nif3-like dinuclear metal center hexameric protein [Bacteroidales bacterium]